MISIDKLFILFQNQYVDYMHKIQSNLSKEQYEEMKKFFVTFKESDYDGKMMIIVNFINNLMEYSNVIISKDSSIFAEDDLIYGERDSICLIPEINFRPLIKINEQLMWDTIQKMYVLANRIVNEDEKYNAMITRNIFDSFIESLSNSKTEYKSTEFIKNIWNKFTHKLNKDKELFEFKNKCTTNISLDEIGKFIKNNKPIFPKLIRQIIIIADETFNEESNNINVFDLRDDFISLLQVADDYLSDKNNKMMINGLLNIAKQIPFFVNLQEEYNQKMTKEGAHIIISKLIEHARGFNNTQDIVAKIREMLSVTMTKINEPSFDESVDKYIDNASKQVLSIIPMLSNLGISKKKKTK